MHIIKVMIFALLIIFYNTPVSAYKLPILLYEDHPSLAVMDFGVNHEGTSVSIDLCNAEYLTSDYIIARCVENKRFFVKERDVVQKKLESENISTVGIIDSERAQKIGRILGVRYIIYGNVTDVGVSDTETKLSSKMFVNVTVGKVKAHIVARFMDVETGRILMAVRGEGESSSSNVNMSHKTGVGVVIGTYTVPQESVHNALKKAAFDVVDKLEVELFGCKDERKGINNNLE